MSARISVNSLLIKVSLECALFLIHSGASIYIHGLCAYKDL